MTQLGLATEQLVRRRLTREDLTDIARVQRIVGAAYADVLRDQNKKRVLIAIPLTATVAGGTVTLKLFVLAPER